MNKKKLSIKNLRKFQGKKQILGGKMFPHYLKLFREPYERSEYCVEAIISMLYVDT